MTSTGVERKANQNFKYHKRFTIGKKKIQGLLGSNFKGMMLAIFKLVQAVEKNDPHFILKGKQFCSVGM